MIKTIFSLALCLVFIVAFKPIEPISDQTYLPSGKVKTNDKPEVARQVEFLPDWTAVPWGRFKLIDPPEITNPVLTAQDVTDREAASVADPFLFHENGIWYMFMEVYDLQTS